MRVFKSWALHLPVPDAASKCYRDIDVKQGLRQTDRQALRQTGNCSDSEARVETDRQILRQTVRQGLTRQTGKHWDRQANVETVRQGLKQTGKNETDRQILRQTVRQGLKQTGKHWDRQANVETDSEAIKCWELELRLELKNFTGIVL